MDAIRSDPLDALMSGHLSWVAQTDCGEIHLPTIGPSAVLSGSFNPLHRGHWQLAAVAERKLGRPVAFEISIANVDKPDIALGDLMARLDQFHGLDAVAITRAATFEAKARLFPECIFVVGADTAIRILQPRCYGNDPERMHDALNTIRANGCRFLVGGRLDPDGPFVELDAIGIPDEFRDLFMGLSETEFRVDISSTELRIR